MRDTSVDALYDVRSYGTNAAEGKVYVDLGVDSLV